jgi:hypothetical protein
MRFALLLSALAGCYTFGRPVVSIPMAILVTAIALSVHHERSLRRQCQPGRTAKPEK